ncbi:MAG: delta 1-pyrroline-5-carboxylate reductase, partial [Vezdaea acicularis]
MSMNGLLPSISVLGTKEDGLTLTVLGCGTMGIAILSGVLTSLSQPTLQPGTQTPSTSGTSTPVRELPSRLPTKFIACVRRPESAKRIKKALLPLPSNVTILQNENLKGVQEADVVLLGCKPQMVRDVLGTDEMRRALRGKMLISICAGVTEAQVEEILHIPSQSLPDTKKCRVVRAMPNTASILRESMTVISTPSPPLPAEMSDLVHWMFSSIGRTLSLPPSLMDASTALCGSGPAFFALVLESLADGA